MRRHSRALHEQICDPRPRRCSSHAATPRVSDCDCRPTRPSPPQRPNVPRSAFDHTHVSHFLESLALTSCGDNLSLVWKSGWPPLPSVASSSACARDRGEARKRVRVGTVRARRRETTRRATAGQASDRACARHMDDAGCRPRTVTFPRSPLPRQPPQKNTRWAARVHNQSHCSNLGLLFGVSIQTETEGIVFPQTRPNLGRGAGKTKRRGK